MATSTVSRPAATDSGVALVPYQQSQQLAATPELTFSDRQIELIKRLVAPGVSDDELAFFLEVCRATGLNPLLRQIYAIKRKARSEDSDESGHMTIQTGIDGYRLLAARTQQLAGIDDPLYDVEDGAHPGRASVTVYRLIAGQRIPFTATARWREYAALTKDDKPVAMWAKMPWLMLGKCFSPDTEVLTETGFHRFDRLSPNCGRILQVTESGLEPVDAKPFVQDYSGPMVTLDSDDLNFCVTPHHDMVTTAGKIEAGLLYEQARTRPQHFIPRTLAYSREPLDVTNQQIQLAAAYIADGYDYNEYGFKIEVSRPAKVEALRAISGYIQECVRAVAGAVAHTATRTITTRSDKASFDYDFSLIAWLCSQGKRLDYAALLMLNREQARLFVDTLIAFDGHADDTSGVRRFYTSRPDHLAAFEMACVAAGYSVSQRKSRLSDISTTPNYNVTISDRNEIPVVRWGREYQGRGNGNAAEHTGLELTANTAGQVWCVTVPSGVIIVRRNGFSMLCGNCAEALALRRAFPAELSGIYTGEEMAQADNPPPLAYVDQAAPASTPRTPTTAPKPATPWKSMTDPDVLKLLAGIDIKGRAAVQAFLGTIKAEMEQLGLAWTRDQVLAHVRETYIAEPLDGATITHDLAQLDTGTPGN